MPKNQRIRSFSFIIYEENQKNGWKEKISSYFIPCFYILHDKDVKKPHYHVLFMPRNAISERTVREIVDEIGGVLCAYYDTHTRFRSSSARQFERFSTRFV